MKVHARTGGINEVPVKIKIKVTTFGHAHHHVNIVRGADLLCTAREGGWPWDAQMPFLK